MTHPNKILTLASSFQGVTPSQRDELFDYYNRHCVGLVKPSRRYHMQRGDNWCAMFTSVVAHKAGLSAANFPYEVSVREQWLIAKDRNRATTSAEAIQPGDLAVYDFEAEGPYNHVGFISTIEGRQMAVIEGNYRGTVGTRHTLKDHGTIRGFILVGARVGVEETSRIYALAHGVLRGEYGNGVERRRRLGADFEAVQAIINSMG